MRCRTKFFRREGLREHLRRWHNENLETLYRLSVSNGDIPQDHEALLKAIVDKSFTPAERSSSFWCGFCGKTIKTSTEEPDRYDHIGAHFDRMIRENTREEWRRAVQPVANVINAAAMDVVLSTPYEPPKNLEP